MTAQTTPTSKRRMPGDEGLWIFVLGDLFVFSLLFGTYLYYRGLAPVDFDLAQQDLNVWLGTLNTLVLLTSSWMVASAVHAARASNTQKVQSPIKGAILLGLLFCAMKGVEYFEKAAAGYGLGSDGFFMFFFMLTGVHLIHVLVGIVVLWLLAQKAAAHPNTGPTLVMLESGALYWHLVDLLWIILFPLFYLLHT